MKHCDYIVGGTRISFVSFSTLSMQQLDRFERKRRGFNRKTMTQERSHYPPLRINDNSQFASESRCRGSSRELYTVKSKETRHPIPPRNVLSDCPRFGPWKTIHRPYTLLRPLKQGKKKERKKERKKKPTTHDGIFCVEMHL